MNLVIDAQYKQHSRPTGRLRFVTLGTFRFVTIWDDDSRTFPCHQNVTKRNVPAVTQNTYVSPCLYSLSIMWQMYIGPLYLFPDLFCICVSPHRVLMDQIYVIESLCIELLENLF